MASACPPLPMKIEVLFSHRDDGGLRAYCEAVPGFVLSNRNPDLVMSEVPPVLETILSDMFGVRVVVQPLVEVSHARDAMPEPAAIARKEYVGTPLAA